MQLILIIAAGILLALFLLPFLGSIAIFAICALMIGGGICSLLYIVTHIVEFKRNFKQIKINNAEQERIRRAKKAEHKEWLESLPKDERNAQIKQERKEKLKALLYLCGIVAFVIAVAVWRFTL